MSMTLNLADRLLALGRRYRRLGRTQDALKVFERLAAFRSLEPAVAEETQVQLAEIYLKRCRYPKARRHLAAALVHQPKNAFYHYLMARALEADEKADRQRAAEHFRKSLSLEPNQADCLSQFGLLAIRIGQTEEGLRCLRRAMKLESHDPEIVSRLAEGLQEEGLHDEARRVLQTALFNNARDSRFRQLWNDYQFRELHREQEQKRNRPDSISAEGGSVLPFVRTLTGRMPNSSNRKILRRDPPSRPTPPHTARSGRRTNQHQIP